MCKKFCSLIKWPLIVFVILWLSSCGRTESTQPENDHTEFQVLSMKELYPLAEAAALEWQDDAYLYIVILNVFPANETHHSSADFAFRSKAFPNVYFDYDYLERDTIKVSQSEEEFPAPKPQSLAINPNTIQIDSLDAVSIMYEDLGKEIHADCSIESWPALLILRYRIPELKEPTWSISFDCESPQNWGAIIISAETGEVLEIRK